MSDKAWSRAWKTTGKIFVDMGKLTFGSLILGTILNGGIDKLLLFILGFMLMAFLIVTGIWLIANSKE